MKTDLEEFSTVIAKRVKEAAGRGDQEEAIRLLQVWRDALGDVIRNLQPPPVDPNKRGIWRLACGCEIWVNDRVAPSSAIHCFTHPVPQLQPVIERVRDYNEGSDQE